MAVEVSAFSAAARTEFAAGKLAADQKPFPGNYESFTSRMPSSTRVETHTYMSGLPRLSEFKGASEAVSLVDKSYTVANKTYRIGPVTVRKEDLDDDQTGGYAKSIADLPRRAQLDTGHKIMAHLAAGTTNLCFDGTAMFANSHTFGSGDNLDTKDCASNDGVTHKVIALVTDNSFIKPVIYQDREGLSSLMDDTNDAQAQMARQFNYWADTRFGLGYGFWWDAYHVTITDTPTVAECYELVRQIINGFRTFTLPKGKDSDDTLYVHEGWAPSAANFVLCCNLKLEEILSTAIKISQYTTSTGNVDNVYKDKATVIGTSALGA
jgi:phage major head subunit gpT-like protein